MDYTHEYVRGNLSLLIFRCLFVSKKMTDNALMPQFSIVLIVSIKDKNNGGCDVIDRQIDSQMNR